MRYAGLIAGLLATAAVHADERDTRLFEMRTYYAHPGKFEAMLARFRNHTVRLFAKHGMTNIGYWVPVGDNPERMLVYVLAFPDAESREKSWKSFIADPEWIQAFNESHKDGPLVARMESLLLRTTDYSPRVAEKPAAQERVFELRTYTASPGRLSALHDRFRQHTMKLFAKHGMTNLWYWSLEKGQKGEDETLIYMLAHRSVEAAQKSFAAFREDPDWLAARKASEEKAGGSLTAPNGVKSLFLKATDFSPIR
ncbi:MAG: NIPSNAP family protein [Gemmataceae bacterium]|nr:NIPSNAP family protein [Gemmataceae bacterium]